MYHNFNSHIGYCADSIHFNSNKSDRQRIKGSIRKLLKCRRLNVRRRARRANFDIVGWRRQGKYHFGSYSWHLTTGMYIIKTKSHSYHNAKPRVLFVFTDFSFILNSRLYKKLWKSMKMSLVHLLPMPMEVLKVHQQGYFIRRLPLCLRLWPCHLHPLLLHQV